MPLSPKQMSAAIIKNLSTKTGKSLEAWLSIIENSALTDKKDIMNLLKKTHSLGHFQAQSIFDKFINKDDYKDPTALVDGLFNTPKLQSFYEQIKKEILQIDQGIQVEPCKTYIPFYSKRQFAIVKPYKKDKILLGVNLPETFQHDRFHIGMTGASVRINFQTILDSPEDFNQSIIDVIKIAYANN